MPILRASNIKPPPGSLIDPTHQLGGGVAYWLGNDGKGKQLTDAGPYRNHGILTNMDPPTDWVAERYGYVLDFAGDNDYVDLGSNGVWESNEEGTIVVKFKLNSTLSADSIGELLGFGGGGDLWILGFAVRAHSAWSQATRIDIVSLDGSTPADGVAGSTDLQADVWYQAAFVSNGTSYSLYLDDLPETPTIWSGQNSGDWFSDVSPTQPDNTSIASVVYDSTRQAYFNGQIEYLYIYDSPRIADEIAWLYHEPYSMIIASKPAIYFSIPAGAYVPYPHKSGLGGGIGQIHGGKAA